MTIEISKVTKLYNQKKVVDELTLSVEAGTIVAILGGNGAGKTTLLKMLAGIITPQSGKIKINDLDFVNNRMAIVQNMGFLTRGMSLYDRFSVFENLDILGGLRGISEKKLNDKIDSLVVDLEMSGFLHQKYSKLSSGQKQRALIASTILNDPEIIIFDEVTAELDIISSNYIMKLLKSEKERGKTIIFSTHIVSEAEYICDKIAILDSGRLIAFDSAENLKRGVNALNLTAGFVNIVQTYREAA